MINTNNKPLNIKCPNCLKITDKMKTPDGTFICDECGTEWDSEFLKGGENK
jgi:ribosomal protein S27E